MDPFFARNRLSAYLDGALSDAEASEVAEAIERDSDLRSEFEVLRRTVQLLRSRGPVEAPPGFHARLMERIGEEPAPGGVVVWLRRSFARVPVEALALAAAAAVVVIVIQGRPGDEPTIAESTAPTETSASAAPQPDKGGPAPEVAPAGAGEQDQPPAAAPATDETTDDIEERGTQQAPSPRSTAMGTDSKSKLAPQLSTRGKGEDPYVPGWEQVDQAGDAAADLEQKAAPPTKDNPQPDLSKPYGYRVTLGDSEVLYQLSALAEQAGGRLLDSAGRTVKPHELNVENNYAQVQIVVPTDRAEHVHSRLRKMGASSVPPPPSTPLYGVGQVGFVVEVQYLP